MKNGEENAAESRPAEDAVARLVGARMPLDHGLASLGLLMQVTGAVGLVCMTFLAITPILASTQGTNASTGYLFAFAVLCALRSAYHRAAGTALVHGADTPPSRAIWTYIVIAMVQSAGVGFLVWRSLHDGGLAVRMWILFAAWPATLVVLLLSKGLGPMLRNGIPESEDLGCEGAAVLMSIFGVMGTLFSALLLTTFVKLPLELSGMKLALIGAAALLLVRSVIHAKVGFRGTAGAIDRFDTAYENARTYFSLGVLSALVVGVSMFVVVFMEGSFSAALMTGLLLAALLLTWPGIVKRFYLERNFSVSLAGQSAPVFRRAPDAGLTSLGWFLVASAVVGLAVSLPCVVTDSRASALLGELEVARGGVSRSEWWSVGVSGIQLWAGIELIRMTDRYKLAATIFGAIGMLVALYVSWPYVKDVGTLVRGLKTGASLASLTALVVPTATLILVHRVTVPGAVARLRSDASR